LKTVRSWTPNTIAMSEAGTPSAMNSSAWARTTIRRSAFSGRIAISISARCLADKASGTVGRPTCGRFAQGLESIMSQPLSGALKHGQISGERN
jgi:hypothetical protein